MTNPRPYTKTCAEIGTSDGNYANLQVRNPAKTKTTLWRQNHSPHLLQRWLIWKTNGKQRFVTFSLGNVPNIFATSRTKCLDGVHENAKRPHVQCLLTRKEIELWMVQTRNTR